MDVGVCHAPTRHTRSTWLKMRCHSGAFDVTCVIDQSIAYSAKGEQRNHTKTVRTPAHLRFWSTSLLRFDATSPVVLESKRSCHLREREKPERSLCVLGRWTSETATFTRPSSRSQSTSWSAGSASRRCVFAA